MSKLFDVKAHWNQTFSYDFNDKDYWVGQFLLEDDGWFEGVVVDVNSSYKEDRFIFGVFHPGKVIELFKVAPLSVTHPFVFHGSKEDLGYEGTFEVIHLLGSEPYGCSRIVPVELDLEKQQEEIAGLKARIERYKNSIMDETGKTFYTNYLEIRNPYCEIILRNYEDRGFTEEEIQEIEKRLLPVNERVLEATVDEVQRLIKELPDEYLEDPDFFV